MVLPAEWLQPDWAAGGSPGAAGVMTTRAGGVSAAPFDTFNLRAGLGDTAAAVAANHAALALGVGCTPVFLDQVHGTRVVRLARADALPGAPVHQADASITTAPGLACAVQVADCLPVLFAAPAGRGVGAALVAAVIAAARERGYRAMLLDTLPGMTAALRLYERAGFVRIAAYYATPLDDAVFLRLALE